MHHFINLKRLAYWQLLQIQGAVIVASLFEIVIGMSGMVGMLLRYIGPLVIAPTITLLGLGLMSVSTLFCARNWYIALA